jgi:hypothetical protein
MEPFAKSSRPDREHLIRAPKRRRRDCLGDGAEPVANILLNRVDWKDPGAALLSGWPRPASSVCMEYAGKLALVIVEHSRPRFPTD